MALLYEIKKVTGVRVNQEVHLEIDGWCILDDTIPALKLKINEKETDFYRYTVMNDDVVKEHGLSEKLSPSAFLLVVNHIKEDIHHIALFVGDTCIYDKQDGINEMIIEQPLCAKVDGQSMSADNLVMTIMGYAYAGKGRDIDFEVLDENNQPATFQVRKLFRKDLIPYFGLDKEEQDCGFLMTVSTQPNHQYHLVCKVDGEEYAPQMTSMAPASSSNVIKTIVKNFNMRTIRAAINYLHFFGLKNTIRRIRTGRYTVTNYHDWFLRNRVTPEELDKQRRNTFAYQPKLSIIVPTFNTPIEYLEDMVQTVLNQTYTNWELCIADGSNPEHPARKRFEEYAKKDERIKVSFLDKNYGIAGNTNKALELVSGEYTCLYDHDDFLELNALYEIVKVLNEHKYDVIYTDEDKFQNKEKKFIDGNMKPDFSIDLLRSHNYITHFLCLKTEILRSVGGFDSKYDGAQDYDVIFKCCEKAENGIYHLSKVLYHWRVHPGSTAEKPENKMYCYKAGEAAMQAHLDRLHIPAKSEMMPKPYYGFYHVRYQTVGNPLVSIVIPNFEAKSVLERCLNSIFEKNTYPNLEIIIVENNSKSSEIFEYYDKIQKEHDNVHVVTWVGKEFNYSAINNFGVKHAKGDYILFLNNDTEIIDSDAITEMLGHCMRDEVGCVGAKLLYPNNTIQHAGVVVGFAGIAGHVFSRATLSEPGYFLRPLINCDYSAVTAACLMTKKELFNQVGGFDESLKVAFNDIDLCLRIRQLNKLCVYNAFSHWYHYESVSRGYEESEEKRIRFEGEVQIFQKKWRTILVEGDPFYNINFDVNYTPFALH